MEVVLGTIVGELPAIISTGLRLRVLCESSRDEILGLDNSLDVLSLEEDPQDLGGDVGLSDDTDSGDTSVDMPEDEAGFLLPPPPPPLPCIDCCIKQWILNQFDLRP